MYDKFLNCLQNQSIQLEYNTDYVEEYMFYSQFIKVIKSFYS